MTLGRRSECGGGHLSGLGGNSGFTLSILTSVFPPLSPPTQTQISTWFSWVDHFAYFYDFRSELKILYFYQQMLLFDIIPGWWLGFFSRFFFFFVLTFICLVLKSLSSKLIKAKISKDNKNIFRFILQRWSR